MASNTAIESADLFPAGTKILQDEFDGYMAAFGAGDIDKLMTYYAPDAQVFVPGVAGKDFKMLDTPKAIHEYMVASHASGFWFEFKVGPVNRMGENYMVEISPYVVTSPESLKGMGGHCSCTFRQVAPGSWKIWRHIWN